MRAATSTDCGFQTWMRPACRVLRRVRALGSAPGTVMKFCSWDLPIRPCPFRLRCAVPACFGLLCWVVLFTGSPGASAAVHGVEPLCARLLAPTASGPLRLRPVLGPCWQWQLMCSHGEIQR